MLNGVDIRQRGNGKLTDHACGGDSERGMLAKPMFFVKTQYDGVEE